MEKLELLDHRLDRLFQTGVDLHHPHVSLGCIRESLRLIVLRIASAWAMVVRPDPAVPLHSGILTNYAGKRGLHENTPGPNRHRAATGCGTKSVW